MGFENKIEYHEIGTAKVRHVKSVDGFFIPSDKHAYQCKKCGAIFTSKSKEERTIFKTDDPRCRTCDAEGHSWDDLELICDCPPFIFGY